MISSAVFRAITIGASQLLAVVDKLNNSLCLGFWWWERQNRLPHFETDLAQITDYTGFPSSIPHYKLALNEEVMICNGWDPIRIFDGTTFRFAGGVAAPAPIIAAGAAGVLTGEYSAIYTYYDSVQNYETNPALAEPALVTLASQQLAVTVVASSDTRYDKIRIYRNKNGVPATFYFEVEVANANATINLNALDSALTQEVSYGNAAPPITKYVAKTASRVFWAGAREFKEGLATVTQASTTVTLTEAPPQELYTKNVEAPIYFQVLGGPRYGVTAISGSTLTLATPYKESSLSGQSYSLCGLTNRVYYSDLSGDTGLVMLESWNPENFFNIGIRGDAPGSDFMDEITALREYGNRIYAFCRESIWYFDPLISQRKRSGAVTGTLSSSTIQEDRDGNLLYAGTDGQVYAFNGASSVMISARVRNRFAERDRYNLELAEFAWAEYDKKEGMYILSRPAKEATLLNMVYVTDIYDDYTGKWTERNSPRITAACRVRDISKTHMLGIDNMGLVHIIDNYEDSAVYGHDRFTPTTPQIYTSVLGEISPGTDKRGKVAVVFTENTVRGSKLIVSAAHNNVETVDLGDVFTVMPDDNYIIGGWQGSYETGWMNFGDAERFKAMHYIEGTFIAGSSGFLYISWYVDEGTTPIGTVRVDVGNERKFKRHIPGRGQSVKLKFESVSELVGFAIRDFTISFHLQGDV